MKAHQILILAVCAVLVVLAARYFSPMQSCVRSKVDSGAAADRPAAIGLCRHG